MSIIRSSRVLYNWSLPVVFGALIFKLSVWCGAEGCVSGLRAAALFPLAEKFEQEIQNVFIHYMKRIFFQALKFLDYCKFWPSQRPPPSISLDSGRKLSNF